MNLNTEVKSYLLLTVPKVLLHPVWDNLLYWFESTAWLFNCEEANPKPPVP